ncbi:synaptotagmin-16 [Thrips palmi]|uniref:Synaptotagmin-16 n=1 Tax=Thrips palmi TaxID=161013 RepID=A0A6P8YD32_THRPL|nr:synaptotagmin-16 [Thrips palmi]
MPVETAYTNVPVVVGVAGVLAVIAAVILYLNKRWCLTGINSLNCCDDAWGIRLAPRPRKTDLAAHTAHTAHSAPAVHGDPMSMAERGLGPNPSCNASTTSASTTCSEEEKMLRHREGRGDKTGGQQREQPDGSHPSPVANFAGVANGNGAIWPGYPPRYAHRTMEPPLEVPEPRCPPCLKDQCDNQDCIVMMHQDDGGVSDIQSVESTGTTGAVVMGGRMSGRCGISAAAAPFCACGQLEVSFAYDAPMRNMTIHLMQARDIPARDRGGASHTQVRIVLLPTKKQRLKSKVRHGENPQFMESILFNRINPEDVNSMGVRFRLYGCGRMRRERFIGESIVSFSAINLESETNVWLNLEPRANMALKTSASDLLSLARSDSTGSSQSMQMQLQHGGVPELLVGLSYNGTTGRLSVELVKGSHFRNMTTASLAASLSRPAALSGLPGLSGRPIAPDTYVTLRLASSSGQEIGKARSSVRRGQPNPLFKETYVFQVPLFQLPDVTLLVSVYNKRSMKKKEAIGWFALGAKSSGEEEAKHWNDMCEVRGEQILRWHVLLDT